MSSFSLRYSDENNKVGLLFHFAKVVRIRERSSASLCNSGEDKVRGPLFCFASFVRIKISLFHFATATTRITELNKQSNQNRPPAARR